MSSFPGGRSVRISRFSFGDNVTVPYCRDRCFGECFTSLTDKATVVSLGRRMTFRDAIEYSNHVLDRQVWKNNNDEVPVVRCVSRFTLRTRLEGAMQTTSNYANRYLFVSVGGFVSWRLCQWEVMSVGSYVSTQKRELHISPTLGYI